MSQFVAFACAFGIFLAANVTIAAWLFRSSSAPFAAKIMLPTLVVVLACYTPWTINSMLGYPTETAEASLPDNAQLIAFVPHDAEKRVTLWLRTGDDPRAYDTVLSGGLKRELRKAKDAMAQGRPAMLRRRGGEPGQGKGHSGQGEGNGHQQVGDPLGIGDDGEGPYILDQSAMTALPPKE